MQRNFLDFCDRQAAKMIKYADGCPDMELKNMFLKMAADWLRRTAPTMSVVGERLSNTPSG
jgi:hypothetical protein